MRTQSKDLAQNQDSCSPGQLRRGSPLSDGRGDLRPLVSGYINPGSAVARWSRSKVPLLLVMLGASASLYFSCFRFPLIPIWANNVQFAFIELANRMWDGQVYYRDFFYVTTPGYEVIYLLFFRLFGLRNWMPNMVLLLVGLLSTALITYICRKVIRPGRLLPFLPAALFLAYAFERIMRLQDSHRWSSSAALLGALAAVLEARTPRRLIFAGALCGIASFFTQTQGVFGLVAIAIFLSWEGYLRQSGWRKVFWQWCCLAASFFITVFATNAYFVWKAGLEAFLNYTVRFPAVYFPRDPLGGSFHAYLEEVPRGVPIIPLLHAFAPYFFLYILVPFVYIAFFIWYRLRATGNDDELRILLVNLVGLFSFAGIAMSPDYLRICSVSAPALIVLIYFLQGKRILQRTVVALLWITSLFSLVHHPIQIQRSVANILQLPRGPIAFFAENNADYQELDWLSKQTHPGQIYFTINEPGIFYPLALRAVDKSSIGYQDNGVTRPEDVADAIATLEKYHVKLIQWPLCKTPSQFYDPRQDHLDPLRTYVAKHYHLAKSFDSMNCGHQEEIWMRNQ